MGLLVFHSQTNKKREIAWNGICLLSENGYADVQDFWHSLYSSTYSILVFCTILYLHHTTGSFYRFDICTCGILVLTVSSKGDAKWKIDCVMFAFRIWFVMIRIYAIFVWFFQIELYDKGYTPLRFIIYIFFFKFSKPNQIFTLKKILSLLGYFYI